MDITLLVGLPGLRVVAIAVAEERAADPLDEARETGQVPGLQALVHQRHQPGAGVSAELLERHQLGQERLGIRRVAAGWGDAATGERLGDTVQRAPSIDARL